MELARPLGDCKSADITDTTSLDILRLLDDDSPIIRRITVMIPYGMLDAALVSDEDLGRIGRAIAKNTNLTTLRLCCAINLNKDSSRHALHFLDMVGKNRHIRHFSLHGGYGFDAIETEAFGHLSSFIKNNENLESFEITHGTTPEVVGFLVDALERRSGHPLKKITLNYSGVKDDDVKEMMSFFMNNPSKAPGRICLDHNNFGDNGCFHISKFVRKSGNIFKEIGLRGNKMGPCGLRCIASALTYHATSLERFSIGENHKIGDPGVIAFVEAFASYSNSIPSHLAIEEINIGPEGMKSLGIALARQSYPIESLHLKFNHIGDYELMSFLECFRSNPSLIPKTLDLTANCLGHWGLVVISDLLRNRCCSLERLNMANTDPVPYDTVSYAVNSVKCNSTLRELNIDTCGLADEKCLDLLSSVVCDTTSIQSTYLSNHTLVKFGNCSSREISLLLAVNSNPNKSLIARHKVIYHHFAKNFRLDLFQDMQPAVLVEVLTYVYRGFACCDKNEKEQKHAAKTPGNLHRVDGLLNNSLGVTFLILKNCPVIMYGRKK